MLNCHAVVMFTVLILATSCGSRLWHRMGGWGDGGVFESSKSFMDHRSALLLVFRL